MEGAADGGAGQDAAAGADGAATQEDGAGPPAGGMARIGRACSLAAACTFGPEVGTDVTGCVERLVNHVAGGSEPWEGQAYDRLLGCA